MQKAHSLFATGISPRRARPAFSFIELMTVVAMIAILASAAVPMASSLYQRNRENALRETLLVMRMAIRDFHKNGIDDDNDGLIDEDPRGDANHDGFPGIRGVPCNRGLNVDRAGQPALLPTGLPNPFFDWRFRADDDEDGKFDEEAYPKDLNDLVNKMGILRGKIPVDPTTGEASWRIILARINNDGDWGSSDLEPATGQHPGTPVTIVLGPPDMRVADPATGLPGYHPMYITAVVKWDGKFASSPAPPPALSSLSAANFTPLVDEDPADGIDNDGDGMIDEDCPEVIDVRSWNTGYASDGTKYSDW